MLGEPAVLLGQHVEHALPGTVVVGAAPAAHRRGQERAVCPQTSGGDLHGRKETHRD